MSIRREIINIQSKILEAQDGLLDDNWSLCMDRLRSAWNQCDKLLKGELSKEGRDEATKCADRWIYLMRNTVPHLKGTEVTVAEFEAHVDRLVDLEPKSAAQIKIQNASLRP